MDIYLFGKIIEKTTKNGSFPVSRKRRNGKTIFLKGETCQMQLIEFRSNLICFRTYQQLQRKSLILDQISYYQSLLPSVYATYAFEINVYILILFGSIKSGILTG